MTADLKEINMGAVVAKDFSELGGIFSIKTKNKGCFLSSSWQEFSWIECCSLWGQWSPHSFKGQEVLKLALSTRLIQSHSIFFFGLVFLIGIPNRHICHVTSQNCSTWTFVFACVRFLLFPKLKLQLFICDSRASEHPRAGQTKSTDFNNYRQSYVNKKCVSLSLCFLTVLVGLVRDGDQRPLVQLLSW